MTRPSTKLDTAIAAVRDLPESRQDELADAILAAANTADRNYTSAQLQAIDEGLADADAGRFASDEDVERLFARFRGA